MASQKNVREIAPVNVVRLVEQEPYKVGDRVYILGGKDPVAGNVVEIGECLGIEFLRTAEKRSPNSIRFLKMVFITAEIKGGGWRHDDF